jgi:hypothetical protein
MLPDVLPPFAGPTRFFFGMRKLSIENSVVPRLLRTIVFIFFERRPAAVFGTRNMLT